jgi:hypothetical protein
MRLCRISSRGLGIKKGPFPASKPFDTLRQNKTYKKRNNATLVS